MAMHNVVLLFTILLLVSCSDESADGRFQEEIVAEVLSELSDSTIDVDYLVITPEALLNSARKLCSDHNLDTTDDVHKGAVVSLNSIIDLYPGDTVGAILSFLEKDASRWKISPKYVVLMGHTTLADGSAGIPVPVKASDAGYVNHDNIYLTSKEGVISRIVARIPVQSEHEFERYRQKVKRYKTYAERSALFISDNSRFPSFPEWMRLNDYEYDIPTEFPISIGNTRYDDGLFDLPFQTTSEELGKLLEKTGRSVEHFLIENYMTNMDSLLHGLSEYDDLVTIGESFFFPNREKMRDTFFDKVNKNYSLRIYLGHASPESFTVETLYSFQDTTRFTTPSIVLHLGCFSGEFTSDSSMTRKLMFSSDGGPVAFIGAADYNYMRPGESCVRSIFESMNDDQNQTLGELWKQAIQSGGYDRFILLGDPALKIM